MTIPTDICPSGEPNDHDRVPAVLAEARGRHRGIDRDADGSPDDLDRRTGGAVHSARRAGQRPRLPYDMTAAPIHVLGRDLPPDTEHVVFGSADAERIDPDRLAPLQRLPKLRAVSVFDLPVDDEGLAVLCRLPSLDNLCLQNVAITNDGLRHLSGLPRLAHLRLKDNPQLDDRCTEHLTSLHTLRTLGLHETSVTQHGIDRLVTLQSLEMLVIEVWEQNFSFDALRELSRRMPRCELLAKGRGSFVDGQFDGRWDR